jgi:ABC-type multidrug transport system fused ATPase/permease subunit
MKKYLSLSLSLALISPGPLAAQTLAKTAPVPVGLNGPAAFTVPVRELVHGGNIALPSPAPLHRRARAIPALRRGRGALSALAKGQAAIAASRKQALPPALGLLFGERADEGASIVAAQAIAPRPVLLAKGGARARATPRVPGPVARAREAFRTVAESLAWIKSFWARVLKTDAGVRRNLAWAAALSLAMACASFIPPVLIGEMSKNLIPLGQAAAAYLPSGAPWTSAFQDPVIRTFLRLGGMLSAAFCAQACMSFFFIRLMYDIGNALMKSLNDLFMDHVLRLPMSWHDMRNSGDVLATAEAIYTVQRTSTDIIVGSVKNGTFLLGSLAGMLYVSWPMTLIAAPFLAALLSIPAGIFSNRVHQAYKRFYSKLKPKLTGTLAQLVSNIETVKSSGKEDREMRHVSEWSRRTFIDGGGEIARLAAPFRAMSNGITEISRVLVVLAAVLFIYLGIGGMSIASATTYFFLANYFKDAVQNIYDTYVSLKQMRGSSAKFDEIMGSPLEDYVPSGKRLPPSARGRSIRFERVSFGYQDSLRILQDVDLDIAPGETVAFVGGSGSGKTTLARLVLGLYAPQEGRILIDGTPLKDIDKRDFRNRVGSILQDPVPFDQSIAYNIAYLNPEAGEEEIWAASREAGLHPDVVRMGYHRTLDIPPEEEASYALAGKVRDGLEPARRFLAGKGFAGIPESFDPRRTIRDNIAGTSTASPDDVAAAARAAGIHYDVVRLGYLSAVGERGVALSGGQKQRLLLARLFANADKPWDIMILDEPTSALDGLTQALIQRALERRRGKSTTLVIAHRLSTVQKADKIVVLSKGRVVESGTHGQLMGKKGTYAKLWEAQRLQEDAEETQVQKIGPK